MPVSAFRICGSFAPSPPSRTGGLHMKGRSRRFLLIRTDHLSFESVFLSIWRFSRKRGARLAVLDLGASPDRNALLTWSGPARQNPTSG